MFKVALRVVGRFLRAVKTLADENSEGRRAANNDGYKVCQLHIIERKQRQEGILYTYGAFEYRPQEHPLWFWRGSPTTTVDA
jgi:hypothetical protein